jgi:hypothetical protein
MEMTASTRLLDGVTIVDLSAGLCWARECWTASSGSQPGERRE